MNTEQLKKLCLSLPGAVCKELAAPGNLLSYSIQGKKFAYFKTSKPQQWRFSLRVTAERFLELTDQPGINPARYMHRFHWVSIVNVSTVDEDYLTELLLWSYHRAVQTLPKRAQKLIPVQK
ncbi:MAG: MmcQ/YjbR family DNA-binding protein [Pseudomonadales bacterium]|nr:MmcQ/YjbR family DNA-binding protein [Pseudomonadales bacterium]NRA17757.1 MmcQ/YjbR family DNA-binding protein [Oceanospirillaceae bacterium]